MRNILKAIRFGAYTTVTACLFLFAGSKAFVSDANGKTADSAAKSLPADTDFDKDKKRLA